MSSPTASLQPVVRLRDVTQTYTLNRSPQNVLDGVNLDILPGEFVLLRGDNGSGKTTLVNLMVGLQPPTSGSVELFGRSPQDSQARRSLGVMLQRAQPIDKLSVTETVRLFRSYYDRPLALDDTITRARLTTKAKDEAARLAGGQAQSLYFALAIVGDPDFLILDEPTNNLSQEARANFWKQVREFDSQGKTIVAISHSQQDYEELTDLVTREICLSPNHGKIEEVQRPRYQALLDYHAAREDVAQKLKVDTSSAEVEAAIACEMNAGQKLQSNLSETVAPPPSVAEAIETGETNSSEKSSGSFRWRAFGQQLYVEMLQSIRSSGLTIVCLGLAIGAGYFSGGDPAQSRSLLSASLAGLLLALCFNLFSLAIASERDRGWLKLLRVTPLSFATYLAAKVTNFLLFALTTVGVAIAAMEITSYTTQNGEMVSLDTWMLGLCGILAIGILPFALLGFALGYLLNAKMLGYAQMFVFIGIAATLGWHIPALNLPAWTNSIVLYSPAYHYSQLVAWVGELKLAEAFEQDGYRWLHLNWLLWWSAIAGLLARWAYRRERLSG